MIKQLPFFNLLLPLLLVQLSYAQDLLPVLTDKFGVENVIVRDSSAFKEYYEIKFRQPVDHQDPSKGFFCQVVLLGHNDALKPMVIETNGYEILPYQDRKYVSEPAKILNGNQIIVEHRYFGKSIPDNINNSYLDFKQIAADHHNIKYIFSDIYKSDWVATGASKGGVTALNYSYYYPDDIKASFVYVAPFLNDIEDTRITTFLKEKRSTEIGQKLFTIQKDLLKNKQKLLPVFLDILKLSNLDIGTTDPETLYDFAVLEFDFNYWQYISDYNKLVEYKDKSLEDLTKKGLKNTSLLTSENEEFVAIFPMCIWYLLDEKLSEPFFYQSFTQMGSYGYEEELFTGLKSKNYSPEYLAGKHPKYSTKYARDIDIFLEKKVKNTIFVYGAEDPWTACKANISTTGDNLLFINPNTNHATKIKDLGVAEKNKVSEKLSTWLSRDVVIK